MHRIEMTYIGKSSHFEEVKVSITSERDGSLEHAVDTFRAFLMGMGFHPETIDRVVPKYEV